MFNAASSSGGGSSALPLLLLVGVFALMYFLVIRPQSQRRKKMQQMQSTVDPGSPVLTLGGLYGTVLSVDDDTVLLEVSPGVTNRYAKAAVSRVLTPEEAEKAGLGAVVGYDPDYVDDGSAEFDSVDSVDHLDEADDTIDGTAEEITPAAAVEDEPETTTKPAPVDSEHSGGK